MVVLALLILTVLSRDAILEIVASNLFRGFKATKPKLASFQRVNVTMTFEASLIVPEIRSDSLWGTPSYHCGSQIPEL